MQTLINIIVAVGVPATVAGLVYIGRKLQILDDMKATIDKIKTNLKVVSDFLTRNNKNFNPTELEAYSPLSLTDEGKKFVASIGFTDVFDAHQGDFFRCIEVERPKLKYDVELAAIKSISVLYDKEYMSFLKVLFYNQPKRNMENTAPTLGVYVRDHYLVEHPEITE